MEMVVDIEKNGMTEEFNEFKKLCDELGDDFFYVSGPVSKAINLLEGKRFLLSGTHKNVYRDFGQENKIDLSLKDCIVVGNLINISFPIKNVNEVITLLP